MNARRTHLMLWCDADETVAKCSCINEQLTFSMAYTQFALPPREPAQIKLSSQSYLR